MIIIIILIAWICAQLYKERYCICAQRIAFAGSVMALFLIIFIMYSYTFCTHVIAVWFFGMCDK